MKAVNDVKMNKIIQRLKGDYGGKAINITDKIALSSDVSNGAGTKLTYLSAAPARYIYSPDLGVVFFAIAVTLGGRVVAGEHLVFRHVGGYAPTEDTYIDFPAFPHKHKKQIDAVYFCGSGDPYFAFTSSEDIVTSMPLDTILFTGWYFCDGE